MQSKGNEATKKKISKKQIKSELKNAENAIKTEEPNKEKPDFVKKKKSWKKPVKKFEKQPTVEYRNLPSILPKSYPEELIVAVKNLPLKWKRSDLISAFVKFGALTHIQKLGDKSALIGFVKPEEAEVAKQAGKTLVRGQKVLIRSRERKEHSSAEENSGSADEISQRTVLVFRIDPTATDEEIKDHFGKFGEIESMRPFRKVTKLSVEIIFEKESSAEEAFKLHNTMFKESILHVRHKKYKPILWDYKRTLVVRNPGGLKKIEADTIPKLFEDCGEIEKCDLFCYDTRLAMISFKDVESVEKALSLNGKTIQGIQIELERYSDSLQKEAIHVHHNHAALTDLLKKSKKSKVFISRVAEGLTELHITNLFSTCGAVKSVVISEDRSAIVEFENVEGYCNAFTLHETILGGKKLFLKPFTVQEMQMKRRLDDENTQPPKKMAKFKKFKN